ncbi:signal peptidase I [Bacteroidota bacterium]
MSIYAILTIIFFVLSVIGLWRLFEKAGHPGWIILIPFYNFYIWLKIIKKPLWWYIFILIPFINVFTIMLMVVELVKCFEKYGILEQAVSILFPFIYLPYLGFSPKEKYLDPDKRPMIKKSAVREWVDAIIFAVIAATIIRTFLIEAYTIPTSSMEKSLLVGDFLFVSKISYGPKIPNTPIAFPFAHHTMPLTKYKKSYVEWIKLPYYRFPGLHKKIKNSDVVVFNYPDGDTVALQMQNVSYYQLVRDAERQLQAKYGNRYIKGTGRQMVWSTYDVTARPPDKRENYIKRCIGIPGDTLQIIDKQVHINGKALKDPSNIQFQYFVKTKGTGFNKKMIEKLDITDIDTLDMFNYYMMTGRQQEAYACLPIDSFHFSMTENVAEKIKSFSNVDIFHPLTNTTGWDYRVFPYNENYRWNRDNYGPLVIPQQGVTINLNINNLPLYKRIIDVYEGNDLEVKGDKIFINGKESNSYTFQMDYFWMMGDNRHNSADSRYWGFVPMDHIVGKAVFVWLSLSKNKNIAKKVRWKKLFRVIK